MRIFFIIVILLLSKISFSNQLACLSESDANRAVSLLKPETVIVDYCSQCDNYVLSIIRVNVSSIIKDCNYQVKVVGDVLYKTNPIAKGNFPNKLELTALEQPERIETVIDLAYIYISPQRNVFKWLGGVLNLKADIVVQDITIPEDIYKQATKTKKELKSEALKAGKAVFNKKYSEAGNIAMEVLKDEEMRNELLKILKEVSKQKSSGDLEEELLKQAGFIDLSREEAKNKYLDWWKKTFPKFEKINNPSFTKRFWVPSPDIRPWDVVVIMMGKTNVGEPLYQDMLEAGVEYNADMKNENWFILWDTKKDKMRIAMEAEDVIDAYLKHLEMIIKSQKK